MHAVLVNYRPPRIAMLLLALAAVWQWLSASPVLWRAPFVATLIAMVGFAIMMQAWWQFRLRRVAICPTEPTDYLITDGIYRHTRNPMYLGVTLILAGVALWFGTVPFVLAAAAFYLVIELVFCPFEETKLAAAFGDAYATYCKNVRRWV